MVLLSKNKEKNVSRTLLLSIILFVWLIGDNTFSYAQDQGGLPTVKVKKKPKKPVKIRANQDREDIKNNYQQPKTKSIPEAAKDRYKTPRTFSKSGKIKNNYKKPPTRSNGEQVKVNEAKTYASPPIEEGSKPLKAYFWNRLFSKKTSSLYQGEIRLNKNEAPHPGTGYITNRNRKKIDFESLSRDVQTYEGNLKTRRSRQKAEQAAVFEGKLKRASHFLEVKRKQKIAHKTGKYPGDIKVPNLQVQLRRERRHAEIIGGSNGPIAYKRHTLKGEIRHQNKVSREVGLYAGNIKISRKKQDAGEYSFYQGKIRVRTEKYQTRHLKKLSNEVHKFNGTLRVRKAGKNMHPSVSYLKSKTKNSHEQKENYRKWKLKWHHWFKDKEQPKHLKTKTRKPRYDNKEREIWYY